MKALLAPVLLLSLLQTGCQEAVSVGPIDPPKLASSTFKGAEAVEKRLKAWSLLDDEKKLQGLVKNAALETADIYADPNQWPDCKKLFGMAQDMLDSGTIYGITQAPLYHQRAIGMGCGLDVEPLQETYEKALTSAFEGYKEKVPEEEVNQAATYLVFRSQQGMQNCGYHSMRLGRESGRPFREAVASIRKDCERPRQ